MVETSAPSARKSSRKKWLALVAVLAIGAFAFAFDSDWLRPPLEKLITAQTGRPFSASHLNIDLFPFRMHLKDVRFGNPDWAREREMLVLEQADFTLRLLPLLTHGAVVLPEVHLVKPIVDIESADDGRGNWEMSKRPVDPNAPPGAPPELGKLTIDEGILLLRLPPQNADLRVAVSTTDDGMRVDARGVFRTLPLQVNGTTGGVVSILDQSPFPLDLKYQVGPTHGAVSGGLSGAAGPGTDLQLDLAGETLAELFHVLGLTLPETPPYHIVAHVKNESSTWVVSNIDGHVGDSDLEGNLRLQFTKGRPRLEGALKSERLDLDDLGVAVGAPPKTGPGQTASPKQQRQAEAQAQSDKVVPEQPFDIGRLRTMDADVDYTAQSFRGGGRVLDNLRFHALLNDGLLKLRPLDFGIGGGDVTGKVDVDGRNDLMALATDMEFRRIDLKKMFPGDKRLVDSPAGVLGGRAAIHTNGNTPKALVGDASGRVGVASSGGRVSELLLAFSQLDASKIATSVLRGGKTTELRCAVADMDLEKGVLKSRSVVIDAKDTNIHVDGQVSLRDESLDFTMNSLPKKVGAPTLRSPIHVSGTFKNPTILPDKKLVIRGGIAAALGALAGPLAALVPLIETAPGKDANCRELQAHVEEHLQKNIPETQENHTGGAMP